MSNAKIYFEEKVLKRISFFLLFALFVFLSNAEINAATKIKSNRKTDFWVGTWATSPQLVEPNNMPPSPGLTNNTLRQVVRVSIGGQVLRLRFTNDFSKSPVTMKSVFIAASKDGSVIDATTQKKLAFDSKGEVIIPAGGEVVSDPVKFNLKSGTKLAITICYGNTSADVTGHPGSRTTSYILAGDKTASVDFAGAAKTDHWYTINNVEVNASAKTATIAILGNSITDGRGSGTNKQDRWTDILSEKLLSNPQTRHIGVLNFGIGGNCVLWGGLGPTALNRFDRDILTQHGVKWLIIFEGINDIGGVRSAEDADKVADKLIEAYTQMINKAHAKGLKVYGATITPFAKSFYDKDFRQTVRTKVNEWIRTSGKYDAVIDFDKVMQDPQNPSALFPDLQSGDFLHPNESGYQKMGQSVDLNLFK